MALSTRMARWIVPMAVVGLAPVARAVEDTEDVKALGWTADGKSFFFVHEEADDPPKVTQSYVIGVHEVSPRSPPMNHEEFLRQHPLAPAQRSSSRSPGGDASAVVEGGEFTWDAEARAWSAHVEPKHVVRCSLQRGGRTQESYRFQVPALASGYLSGASVTVSAWWSPDRRRIAWFMSIVQAKPNGQGDFEIYHRGLVGFAPAEGPRIEIVSRGIPAQTIDRTLAAIEKAGFAPTLVGEAEELRKKTVVYAAGEWAEQAKRVAAAVPGGATVEPLSWKPPYDMVVALGASANP